MTERIISPTGRGFLLLDSHPTGCFQSVADMIEQAHASTDTRDVERRDPGEHPVVLVIGSSAGYGLAMTVAGLVRHGMRGVGVALERPPGRRTATAGWYRTIATAELATSVDDDFVFVNADAFADITKTEVTELIAKRFGRLDYLIYSVAAPRRVDPRTQTTYQSVIKPLGGAHTTKTLDFDPDGTPLLREITVEPATEAEAADTVQVMGGEDWARWIDALVENDLLNDGFTTVALSYIGSSMTSAIYRDGTIGSAKAHLEQTALELNTRLKGVDGRAFTSVNGAAVTQASTAIPGIALYVSLLRGVLSDKLQSPMEQSMQLWDQLTGAAPLALDEQGRIRLDGRELNQEVQDEVAERWRSATPADIATLADTGWFRTQFRALYGFDVPGVDYDVPVEPDLAWPAK